MGRKSRLKRERKNGKEQPEPKKTGTPLLVSLIRWGVYLTLLTPLVVSRRFFFPYVGPKGLFFMAVAQIIFFLWLFLIIHYPEYRPKLNVVLIAVTLFIAVFALSSINGVDFSRSFWSKHERMSGLLMHLHLFGFFLVLSSTFRSWKEWKKIFLVTSGIAVIVSVLFLLSEIEVGLPGMWSAKGGATLGNSSFLGSYLLFNGFLALILTIKRKGLWRVLAGGAFAIISIALILSSADAARLSFLGALFLLGLFYLIFKRPEFRFKIAGVVILIISTVVLLYLVFSPDAFLHKKMVNRLGAPRFIVWGEGWQAFKDKPFLGWGPENFIIVFSKYYDSYKPIAGGAPWFDRAHNIVFDSLATIGGVGFLAYLMMLGSVFIASAKRLIKKNKFWVSGILTVLVISYFIQNLTVFDMPASFMMLFLILAFTSSLSGERRVAKVGSKSPKYWVGLLLLLVFCGTFFFFVIQPVRGGMKVINSLVTIPRSQTINEVAKNNPNQLDTFFNNNSQSRIELYKKTLDTTPLGKYQIRNFLAGRSQSFIQNNVKLIPQSVIRGEFEFIAGMLEKTRKESPQDFKSILSLAQIYGFYSLVDPQKAPEAIEVAKQAIELSPNHQKAYWALVQIHLYQRKLDKALPLARKAKNLEPRYLKSHQVLIQVLQMMGKQEEAKKAAQEALKIGLNELDRRDNLEIGNYKDVMRFAQVVGDTKKIKEIAQKAVDRNPEWRPQFKNFLGE